MPLRADGDEEEDEAEDEAQGEADEERKAREQDGRARRSAKSRVSDGVESLDGTSWRAMTTDLAPQNVWRRARPHMLPATSQHLQHRLPKCA